MHRIKNLILGGIENKLISLLMLCILLVSGAFLGTSLYQSRLLSNLNAKSNQRQINSISEFGEDMIRQMVTQEMSRTTELEAMVTDENFQDLRSRVKLLGEYAATLLENPEKLPDAPWDFPDASKNGQLSTMIMLADGTDPSDPAIARRIGQILEESNRALCSENKMEMFVTVWIGILDITTGQIKTANGGHENPALCRSRRGSFEFLKDKHGFVLGGMKEVKYKELNLRLEPGDKLFVYTDGVPEAENEEHEFFGTDRLLSALDQASGGTPEEVLLTVREAVNAFAGNAEQFDDLTMLCVEYKGQMC